MTSRLTPIILQKQREVALLKSMLANNPQHIINQILQCERKMSAKKNFKNSLRQSTLAVIAEIKRKSPSKGNLATIKDPIALVQDYLEGGATAISVLTDEVFFGGHLSDLSNIANYLADKSTTLLRKDFIIDELQIAEAIAAGANAILLIVAVVNKHLEKLLNTAKNLGIDAVVEVHNQDELKFALDHEVEIIGVNNRNLNTMEIDTRQAFTLLEHIPKSTFKIAESGIVQPQLAREYYHAGYDAVLIGEALVTHDNPQHFIEACCHD